MASFLSQADLAKIRAQQKVLISEIGGFGDIRRRTYAPNGRGGTSISYAVQANVPMRLWISSGPNGTSEESRFWGEQELALTDAFVIVAWDTDLRIEDEIVYDNRSWKVVGLQANDTHITALRARVESLRNA